MKAVILLYFMVLDIRFAQNGIDWYIFTLMKPFGISEDLPKEIRFARISLVPQMK